MASSLLFKPVEPREAIDYLKSKGANPLPSFAWQDVWQEEHATAFTVAKSAGFDILDDIHQALVKAQEQGLPFRRFIHDLRPTLAAKGWWGKKRVTDPATGESVVAQLGSPRRLQIIFDVNMRMSYAVGNWQRAEEMKATRPHLRYVALDDGRTRPEHLAWHNTVLPIDDAFWKTHYPPNGWRCRCTVQSVGQADLKAHGWAVSKQAPKIKWKDWQNKRTGEIIKVPGGVDAGFGYNAGVAADRAAHAANLMADKLKAAEPELAALAWQNVKGQVQPQLQRGYAKWFDDVASVGMARGEFRTVGFLTPDLLASLMAKRVKPMSAVVTISDKRVLHAMRDAKKAPLPIADLRRLPEIVGNPEAVYFDKEDPALLYVYQPKRSNRKGKAVVRFDLMDKERDAGQRVTTITNQVRTTGTVDPGDLKNTRYERLK